MTDKPVVLNLTATWEEFGDPDESTLPDRWELAGYVIVELNGYPVAKIPVHYKDQYSSSEPVTEMVTRVTATWLSGKLTLSSDTAVSSSQTKTEPAAKPMSRIC
jgi:hypothetical protein